MPLFTKKDDETGQDREKMIQEPDSKRSKSKLHLSNLGNSLRNINATKHVDKLKGSMKWISWIMRKVKRRGAAFPLFMIFVNTLYLVLGGLMFMALEKQPKVEISTSEELVAFFDVLKNSSVGHSAVPGQRSWGEIVRNLTSSDIDQFSFVFEKISSERTAAAKPEWTVLNSIYFCLTVTTTIGYGILAPATAWGRMICVVYALLGIPLTLALMAVIGKIVGDSINDACAFTLKWFQRVYPKYEYESKNQEMDGEVDAPLWLGLLILFLFTTLTAGLHCWMEGWDFGTAFYFQYITYLTIGFGDVVPRKAKFVFINIFLTFLGLAVLSVTLTLIASNLHHQMTKASFIEKLKEDELSEASAASQEHRDFEENDNRRDKPPGYGDEEALAMAGNDANGGKTYGSTSP